MKYCYALILVLLLGFSQSSAQLLFSEDFSYTAGDSLTSRGWTAFSGGTTNALRVISPSLAYTGFPASGIGNAAFLDTTGQDCYYNLTQNISSGSLYAGFLLKDSTAPTTRATGDYFFALLPSNSTTNFTARFHIKSDSGSAYYRIGVSKGAEAAVFSTDSFARNQTYLCVLRYQFNTASTTDDVVRAYVFASGIPFTEPSTPTTSTTGGSTSDATSLGRLALRQGTAANAPKLTIDGIRAATSWVGLAGSTFTAPYPIVVATATGIGTSSARINLTKPYTYDNANWTTLVFLKQTSAITLGTPTLSPNSYTANTNYAAATSRYQNDTAARLVYKGDSGIFTVTGLLPSTTYQLLTYIVRDADSAYSPERTTSGITLALPLAVTGLSFTSLGQTSARIAWTKPAGYNNTTGTMFVFVKSASAITTGAPAAGPAYFTADSNFAGNGTHYPADTNAKNVYKGDTTFVLITGLTSGTTYHVVAYGERDADSAWSNPLAASGITSTSVSSVTALSFASTASTTGNITWTRPGSYVDSTMTTVVFVKEASAITQGTPTIAISSYTANSDFSGTSSTYENDTLAKHVYKGDSSKVTITGLTPATTYYVLVYVVEGSSVYSSATITSGTSKGLPPGDVSGVSITGISSTSSKISWTKPSGYPNTTWTTVVFLKQGSAITAGTPTRPVSTINGISFFGFGSRYQNDTAARAVFKGDTNFVNVTNLLPGQTYHALIYVVRDSDSTYSTNGATANGTTAGPPPLYMIGQVNTTNMTTGNADSLGVRAELRGRVISVNHAPGGLQFMIHDGTGGITISSGISFGYTVNVGDSIMAQGGITSNRGQISISNPDTIKHITATPRFMTPSTVNALGEPTDNELVRLYRVRFVTPPTGSFWAAGPTNYSIITQLGDTVVLRVMGNSTWSSQRLPGTPLFDVVGNGGQVSSSSGAPYAFNGYRIIPRFTQDIVEVYSPFALVEPANATSITAQGSITAATLFTWERCFSSVSFDTVKYLFQVDTITGNFTSSRIIKLSENNGLDTIAWVTNAEWLAMIPVRNVEFKGKWRVTASTSSLAPIVRNSDTSFVINITVTFFTGVNEEQKDVKLVLYPNPTSGTIHLSATSQIKNISVKDLTGRLVKHETVGNSVYDMDASMLDKGVYFFEILTDAGCITQKVVIQ